MYHSIGIIPAADDSVDAEMHDTIPIIRFSGRGGYVALHVPHETPEQATAWLRHLAVVADELAEQVELSANRGLALAERHIAEAKAAAGIGAS
jgi:uncharacterized protein (DUF1684 family)